MLRIGRRKGEKVVLINSDKSVAYVIDIKAVQPKYVDIGISSDTDDFVFKKIPIEGSVTIKHMDTRIYIVSIRGRSVGLSFDAPKSVKILRDELIDE